MNRNSLDGNLVAFAITLTVPGSVNSPITNTISSTDITFTPADNDTGAGCDYFFGAVGIGCLRCTYNIGGTQVTKTLINTASCPGP
jgi:hypothetical protein